MTVVRELFFHFLTWNYNTPESIELVELQNFIGQIKVFEPVGQQNGLTLSYKQQIIKLQKPAEWPDEARKLHWE